MIKDLLNYILSENIEAVCFPSCGQYTLSGNSLVNDSFSKEIINLYPEISNNLAFKLKETGINIPYILGAIDCDGKLLNLNAEVLSKKKFKCLILNMPTRSKFKDEVNINLTNQSLAVIYDYGKTLKLEKVLIGMNHICDYKNFIFLGE